MQGNFLAVDGEEAFDQALYEFQTGQIDRKAFLRALLISRVYVFHAAPLPSDRELNAGFMVSVLRWTLEDGRNGIPFFSSISALKQCPQGRTNFVPIRMAVLFKHAADNALILNPGSDHSETFSPQLILNELCPEMLEPQLMIMPNSDEPSFIEAVGALPTGLQQTLNVFCREHRNVQRVYVHRVAANRAGLKLRYHFTLSVSGDAEQTLFCARNDIYDRAIGRDGVEFSVTPHDDGPFAQYLKSGEPYYRKLERAVRRDPEPAAKLAWWQKILKASIS